MPTKWTRRDLAQLRALVRRAEPNVRRAFLAAVQRAQVTIPVQRMAEKVAAGDLDGALDLVPWDRLQTGQLRNQIAGELRTVYEGAGSITAGRWAAQGLAFTVIDERPLRWLREVAAQRVVELLPDQREAMRVALTEAYRSGFGSVKIARQIRAEVPGTFLHGAWREAVARFEDELVLQGYGPQRVASEVARYQQQLVNARSLSIARTEVTNALSAGQTEAWQQAIDQGIFDQGEVRMRWVPAADGGTGTGPCPLCESFADVGAIPWGEPFGQDVFGAPCYEPAAHPNCRCVRQLERIAEWRSARSPVTNELVTKTLAACAGNLTHAANQLHISRRALSRRVQRGAAT